MHKKICLINPPTRRLSNRPPLGLMYISAYLSSHGIDNIIIDPKGDIPEKRLIDEIASEAVAFGADIVGISCLTTDLPCVRQLVKKIKIQIPNCLTVLGGIHPTLFPEEMAAEKNVDVVVIGEGEYTLYDIVMSDKCDLSEVKGICYRYKDVVRINEKRPMIPNLDDLPLPAFDKVDMRYYLQPNIHLIRGIPISGFYIFASRGCPFRCRFCVNKNIFGSHIRYRDPLQVVDEVAYLYETYNIDGFYIYDDTFGVKKKDAYRFCDELIRRKLPLVWGCATRVNLIDEPFIKKIKAAGCIQVDIGVESGSQRLLDLLRKDITLEQIRNVIRLCKKNKVRVFSNFMINLPTETAEDIDALLTFADELKSDISIFNITCPFPGTDIQIYQKEKLCDEDYPKMSGMASFNTYIDFIEEKCKLSQHRIPIRDILKRIQETIPSPRDIRIKVSKDYVLNLVRYLNFIRIPAYLNCMLRSRKKSKYLRFALGFIRKKNVSTTKI